ncbi:tripartite motif-containing protein 35-like [Nematolebias whitei]|uniref:tripartite motif-containing protein 35-like n=1 Tax=Nematolebias whitei TaxID=451745 RepID=UPI0018988CDD|nr:tripartite motif-containing protein 35-like [Nematolebias whitei]
MSSWPENNISCPICHDIYQDPVILFCSHSLCGACWQQWKTQRQTPECPVCRRICPPYDPPQNLALRHVCEAFSKDSSERHSAAPSGLCSLHGEKFKLFCLEDQQMVCPICRYSRCHTNHSFRPLEEAAAEHRATLQELLRPVHEKKDLLTVAGDNFNQALQNIEIQCHDTERQIKDVFSTIQSFIKKEEEFRLAALSKEKQQKNQSLRMKREAMKREATSLTDIISSTERELRAEDIPFLQNYPNLATSIQRVLSSLTDPTPEPLMEVDKHLNNLPFSIWDKIKGAISIMYQFPSPISTLNAPRVYENFVENRTPSAPLKSAFARQRFSVALPSESVPVRRYKSQMDLTLTR